MAASTEVRVPFVDPEVFGAAFALPGDRQDPRPEPRRPCSRRPPRRGCPSEIIYRPKASVRRAAAGLGHATTCAELVDDVLLERRAGRPPASCDAGPLRRLVADQRSGRRDQSKQIWQLLTLELWYRNARTAGVGAAEPRTTAALEETEGDMKQVAQNYRPVSSRVLDVPAPACQPGGVLVRIAVLADLDRHRADEGQRGQAVAARQGAGPARPGAQGARLGRPAGAGGRPTRRR